MKALLYSYSKKGTAKLIAKKLKIPLVTTDDLGNYDLDDYFIINWGIRKPKIKVNINNLMIINKEEEFKILSEKGYAPKYYSKKFIKNNIDKFKEYPILGRQKKHQRGDYIVLIENRNDLLIDIEEDFSDYFIEFIDKIREFRIHYIGKNHFAILEKIKTNDSFNEISWSLNTGYTEFSLKDYDLRKELLSKTKEVNDLAKLDFCSVDIIMDKEENVYVLEINTASSLDDFKAELYCTFFKEEYNKFLEE